MPNLLKGAVWDPIPIDYSKRAKRIKGRGAVGHIAVSNSKNLRGSPDGNSWHFYLPKNGPAIQQIDMDYMSGASREGDKTLVSFESEGGVGLDVDAPWTPNQVLWAAHIMGHLHITEGAPLRAMTSSLPTEQGFGTHRLGIDPYRVSGGESWSYKYGKECPGDRRHAQRYEVIATALELLGDDMTPAECEVVVRRVVADMADDIANAVWLRRVHPAARNPDGTYVFNEPATLVVSETLLHARELTQGE